MELVVRQRDLHFFVGDWTAFFAVDGHIAHGCRRCSGLMHELEDGFAAAVVFAVIGFQGGIVDSLFKFRAGGSSYLAADHGRGLIARCGERHRAFGGKVDCIRRIVSCIDNARMVIIPCQINNRILDGQLALFKICRIALRAYLDGAVLNVQIAATICTDTIVA